MPIRLIVGLGNPGLQYANTRHNVGAWFVEALATKYHTVLKTESKFKGNFGSVLINQHECKLLCPTTYMNLSGESVRAVAAFYKISVTEILVVHDELDFLPGVVRLKKGGGANGHNGLINIIDHLGSNDFYRLRLGIGKPINKNTMVDYVTHAPSKAETQLILEAISKALMIIPEIIMGDLGKAMQELHSI